MESVTGPGMKAHSDCAKSPASGRLSFCCQCQFALSVNAILILCHHPLTKLGVCLCDIAPALTYPNDVTVTVFEIFRGNVLFIVQAYLTF